MSNSEISQQLEELRQAIQTRYRIRGETLVVFLSPEAHEDSLKAARSVWIEAMKLCRQEDKFILRDDKGHEITTIRKGKIEGPIPCDLIIERHTGQIGGDDIHHLENETYYFGPFILREISRSSYKIKPFTAGPFSSLSLDSHYAPKGLAFEREEATRDQLNDLLHILQGDSSTKE